VLRTIFGPKREEVVGVSRKLGVRGVIIFTLHQIIWREAK
jgi:hypothetical protein